MATLLPTFFRRLDERPDALFYEQPRETAHIDDAARAAAERWYAELLPRDGHVLDLMASFDSHLTEPYASVTGLGLNDRELERNPKVTRSVVYDLNRNEALPFADASFDGAVCTVSVQYMTRPTDTFREVARSLKPGAPFVVTFSTRMFPTKAVLAWRASDDAAHFRLVKSYFEETADFGPVRTRCHTPCGQDPLYAVWAYKEPEEAD